MNSLTGIIVGGAIAAMGYEIPGIQDERTYPRRWGRTAAKPPRIEYLKLTRGDYGGVCGTKKPYDVVAERKRRKAQRIARRASR